jgi:flagellar biosynthesis/type III secretory pathway protein FliH
LRPARKRNAWLPNRMFDPVSNPFAIQNLLDRHTPPFAGQQDERPDAAFGTDPLAGGSAIRAFEVDRGLQLPEDDFAVDTEVSGEFTAEDSRSDADFEADDANALYAAFTGGDDAVDDAASVATTDQTADAAPVLAEQAASDLLADAEPVMTSAEAVATIDLPPSATEAEVVAESVSESMAEADATDTLTTEAISSEALAQAAPVMEAAAPIMPTSESMPESVEPEPEPELSSEAVMQHIEAARADAYSQALEIGRSEGRDAERPLARQQGYDEGFAAGVAQAKAESQTEEQKRQQQEHQEKLAQLQAVIDNLQQLTYNPDAMFEPMKKLAVHLAEQLVRGELAQSPQAISRLIDNALRELNASGDKAVIIHLHPEDLEAYRPLVASFGDSLILRPDSMLERGSVRVSLDGSVVEDLMQRRVDGVKKSLAQAPAPSWRAGGNSLASRVQQGHPVDDVTIVDNADKKDKTLESMTPADGHA